jgi:polyketide synthase 5
MADSRTGVFVGLTHADYALLAADAHALEGPYGFTGNNFGLASGRIAYTLGVHGPAATEDSACSSGLLAVHMACRSLHEGGSDLAVAGGDSVMLEPRKSASGSAQGMLSPTGRCHRPRRGAAAQRRPGLITLEARKCYSAFGFANLRVSSRGLP